MEKMEHHIEMIRSVILYLPLATSLLGTAYVTILSIMRWVTHESSSLFATIIDIFKIAIILPVSYHAIYLTNNEYQNIGLLALTGIEIYLILSTHANLVAGNAYSKVDLSGKVYIVTGSNTGIGYETAKELVRMNATVVLACRSPAKANEARNAIIKAIGCAASKVVVLKLDLCGFDSVRKFVKDFRALSLGRLDGLINNAGLMMNERSLTQDGFEMVFTANHLSHFLLTNLLLSELEKTSGRVVVVSSSMHKTVDKIDFDDIMCAHSYSMFGCYSQSKLANILFAFELQRRLTEKGSKVTCNVAHPGIVRTEFTRHMNPLVQLGNRLAAPLMLTLQKTPLQGANCSIHLASAPALTGRGGEYYVHSAPAAVSQAALNKDAAAKLWALSEKLTGLKRE